MAAWKMTNGRPVRRKAIIHPVVMILLMGACSSPTVDTYRATPEADSTAAGICATYTVETIRVEIFD
jgi:uncharacterized lipoprotein YmbA